MIMESLVRRNSSMNIKLLKKVSKNKNLTDNEKSTVKSIIRNMKIAHVKEINEEDFKENIRADIYHKYCGVDCDWNVYSRFIENIMFAVGQEE